LNQGWPTTFSLLRPLQVNFGLVLHRPIESTRLIRLWFAKTLADFEINDIAALPPLFRYNS